MPSQYRMLLDATIAHIEELRTTGVAHVPARQAVLDALKAPAHQPGRPAAKLHSALHPNPTSACNPPATQTAPTHGRSPNPKESAMAELRERTLACRKCPSLAAARQNVVFGVGNVHSPLMLVGEAPGADEDARGEPFVGRAGQLLTRILETMGLARDKVYIANILKCRPDTPGQTSGNRKPTPEEMAICMPHLLAQIDIIQPRVLVALGATAVEGLLGQTQGISRLRGHWSCFRGIPVMPTYHPAYLLRNQSLNVKRQVWEDMLKVMERLELPISDRQRRFFLKG